MKIAQVAPLIESVPPRLYGGTERIVSYLTEELVRLGHDVTLFASGDSIASAELATCCTRALRLDPTVCDIIPHFMHPQRQHPLSGYWPISIRVALLFSMVTRFEKWSILNRLTPSCTSA